MVDPGARIGALCVVERGARIGAGTVLKSRVHVGEDCVIGARCLLHPGVVIGADGFGFAPHQGAWEKIEQLGAVRIGDDVEIGANTCIDRGALDDTVIEDGVKLDNLIQIGHNVRIGRHTAIAGCVGVAGSATIGAHCTIGGGAGILGHLTHRRPRAHLRRSRWSRAPSTSPASTPASFPSTTMRPGKRTRPRSSSCTACASASRRSRRNMIAPTMDIHQILKLLPHRYPFLLVDRVLAIEKGKRIRALKNVTINEPFFNGHFPHRPVMPGVLMLEAMAQAAALLSFATPGRRARRQDGLLLRRHRRRALQAAGGARRPADAGRRAGAQEGRHLQVQGPRARRRGARLRGRADVRDAHGRLSADGAIHPTAIVDPRRELDASVQVGPYAVIGPHVKIGAGTTVGAHCVIEGHTTIGRDNRIFQFASLGAATQDKKYAGEPSELVIGDRNTIREFCTFNIGTPGRTAASRASATTTGSWPTCTSRTTAWSATTPPSPTTRTLAGHVELGDWVTVGGLTGSTSSCKIGAHAMIGFASAVSQDVPPFMLVDGNPLAVRGCQLRWACAGAASRRRASPPSSRCTRLLYREGRTLDDARAAHRRRWRRPRPRPRATSR